MFSAVYVFRRPPTMSIEEFEHHYHHIHGPLAARLPGLISYTQHPVRRDAPATWHVEKQAAFDALSIYTYESDEAAQAAFASIQNMAVQEDSWRLIDFDFESMITLPIHVRKVT